MEQACALLISSGLHQYLWEEAMKQSIWLQNRTPTQALDGKTLYEMKTNKKPHLGGIKEFGAAAYVKDLHAGKLDARARVGRFVGYDSESKGYCIYWPDKKSVTVEWNIVFNENDTTLEDTNLTVLAEGEKEKIIQAPMPNQSTI